MSKSDRYRVDVSFDSVDDDKETFMKILQDVFKTLEGRLINFHRGSIIRYQIQEPIYQGFETVKDPTCPDKSLQRVLKERM